MVDVCVVAATGTWLVCWVCLVAAIDIVPVLHDDAGSAVRPALWVPVRHVKHSNLG